jgi:Ribonuclease G/E
LPEWLIERGIGETRAALVENGSIIEARIELEGISRAGTVLRARLANVGRNGRNAIAVDDDGREFLLPDGAAGVTEGAPLTIQVRREAMPSIESWKRPLARTTTRWIDRMPTLAQSLGVQELPIPRPRDEFGASGWNELLEEARTGTVTFAGGELRIAATPAMTLIDVDGFLDPAELAACGAAETAKAIRRLDIGGSIGIDLPTVGSKAARQAAAAALDEGLVQPFERTAVKGFGFLQIVRPRVRASLIELAQDRPAFEARALLRLAAFERPGAKRLVAHPAVAKILEAHPDWLEALGRQLGGALGLRADPVLPMSGAYAESA